MSKFTPGPWGFDPDTYLTWNAGEPEQYYGMSVVHRDDNDEREVVAHIEGEDLEHLRANARLIAAAPDLLEALRLVLSHLGDIPEASQPIPVKRACRVAQAAIAKAEGEK